MAVFVFLFYVAAGLTAALAVVAIGEEGRKFFLFNGAIALIAGGVSLALRVLAPGRWGAAPALAPTPLTLGAATSALALLAAYLVTAALGPDRRWLLRIAAAGMVIAVAVDAHALHAHPASGKALIPASALLHVLNASSSAWLSGSILLAMILGHFYLVIPGLSIEPLRRLFRLSLAGLVLRILLVSAAGLLWWSASGPGAFTVAGFLREGVFVLQRVLFGLVIPASLAWFTWKTIEMRSTQSATGILYVVVFLTLVGEALSVYLSLATTIPI